MRDSTSATPLEGISTSFTGFTLKPALSRAHVDAVVDHAASVPGVGAPDAVRDFISRGRQDKTLGLCPIIALGPRGEPVGSVTCQRWRGPLPLPVKGEVLDMGSVWGLHVVPGHTPEQEQRVAHALVKGAIGYLRSLGCNKVVASHLTAWAAGVLESLGFVHGNARVLHLSTREDAGTRGVTSPGGGQRSVSASIGETPVPGVTVFRAGAEADDTVVGHWLRMWEEAGVPPAGLLPGAESLTLDFIKDARARLKYTTIAAREDATGRVIGTASCQVLEGTMPLDRPAGAVWAVYTHPEHRRQGVARRMMEAVASYLAGECRCESVNLLFASEAGCRVYERVGWAKGNMLVLEGIQSPHPSMDPRCPTPPCANGGPGAVLGASGGTEAGVALEIESLLQSAGTSVPSPSMLHWLAASVPHQLAAVCEALGDPGLERAVTQAQNARGCWVDPSDNWFTRNLDRLGGGFNMERLQEKDDVGVLAHKFTRLSHKWEDFVTGCGYRPVFDWLAGLAGGSLDNLPGSPGVAGTGSAGLRAMDVACGIGLPGQTLRLMGYQGYLAGCDISPGMLDKADSRCCFDETFVCDLQRPASFPAQPQSLHLAICTGALELLDPCTVLGQVAEALVPGGELWASFQWDDGRACPTEHQNVFGVTEEKARELLLQSNFDVISVEPCPRAFVTPLPGGAGVADVAYLFVRAVRSGHIRPSSE